MRRAAQQLAGAETAAEVLEARDQAAMLHDLAKRKRRLEIAKGAHDELVVSAAMLQADAVEIESLAKARLADEYDLAQERGEIRKANQGRSASALEAPNAAELGMTHKQIFEARRLRDAERAEPGFVRRVLDQRLANGEEPSRAAIGQQIAPPAPRRPLVDSDALWLWGRLRDFERDGYFTKDPHRLLAGMTVEMREDVAALLPPVIQFLNQMKNACDVNA